MGDDHSHRVVGKAHHRSTEGVGGVETYEPGDPITPSDAELDAFPRRFERVDESDESDRSGASEADPAETPDEATDDESGDASADETDAADEAADEADAEESDEPDTSGAPPEPLTEAWVEAADYHDLRSASSRFEDVNGNWGADRLRAELAERAEG